MANLLNLAAEMRKLKKSPIVGEKKKVKTGTSREELLAVVGNFRKAKTDEAAMDAMLAFRDLSQDYDASGEDD
jgi:hypothetical protein